MFIVDNIITRYPFMYSMKYILFTKYIKPLQLNSLINLMFDLSGRLAWLSMLSVLRKLPSPHNFDVVINCMDNAYMLHNSMDNTKHATQ